MVNTSRYHQSTLEKVLLLTEDLNPEMALRDLRIQIFIILSENPSYSFTLDELLSIIRKETNIDKELLENKTKVNMSLNLLFSFELISHDFVTKTYKYEDSASSQILKENINTIKQKFSSI